MARGELCGPARFGDVGHESRELGSWFVGLVEAGLEPLRRPLEGIPRENKPLHDPGDNLPRALVARAHLRWPIFDFLRSANGLIGPGSGESLA